MLTADMGAHHGPAGQEGGQQTDQRHVSRACHVAVQDTVGGWRGQRTAVQVHQQEGKVVAQVDGGHRLVELDARRTAPARLCQIQMLPRCRVAMGPAQRSPPPPEPGQQGGHLVQRLFGGLQPGRNRRRVVRPRSSARPGRCLRALRRGWPQVVAASRRGGSAWSAATMSPKCVQQPRRQARPRPGCSRKSALRGSAPCASPSPPPGPRDRPARGRTGSARDRDHVTIQARVPKRSRSAAISRLQEVTSCVEVGEVEEGQPDCPLQLPRRIAGRR